MPAQPDRHPGAREEEAVKWDELTSDPTTERELLYVQNKGLSIFEDGVVRGVGESRVNSWQYPVDELDVDTPPGSPTTGYRVIVGSSPTGVFVGHVGEIAQWTGSAWVFTTPREGSIANVKNENQLYKQNNSSSPWAWGLFIAQGLSSGSATAGELMVADGSGGWDLEEVVSGYPPDVDYKFALAERTTTSAIYRNRIDYTTKSLSLGTYIVFASATLIGTSASTGIRCRVRFDGSNFGLMRAKPGVADGELQFMAFTIKEAISGTHVLKLSYRKDAGSGEAGIRYAGVAIWKIGN